MLEDRTSSLLNNPAGTISLAALGVEAGPRGIVAIAEDPDPMTETTEIDPALDPAPAVGTADGTDLALEVAIDDVTAGSAERLSWRTTRGG